MDLASKSVGSYFIHLLITCRCRLNFSLYFLNILQVFLQNFVVRRRHRVRPLVEDLVCQTSIG